MIAETIRGFEKLYAGGLAQSRRDGGDVEAMPPWTQTYWLGKQVVKCPMDLWTYQEIICETRPEVVIETGTSGGGSAAFFATVFTALGGEWHIVTVDKDRYPELWREHSRITYLVGDSISEAIAGTMRALSSGKRTMVSLDSLHTYDHVRKEIELYAPLVSPGCYLVVEDTVCGLGAERAVVEFLERNKDFTADFSREKHLLTMNRGGWLRR